MIELTLTHEAERYGRDKKHRRHREGLSDGFALQKGTDKRWTGLAVEYVLNQYLVEQEIPHRWYHDAVDDEPDFELGNRVPLAVAVKANNGDPVENFNFLVPQFDYTKTSDGMLLAIVNTWESKVWVAGYISASKFMSVARHLRKGQKNFTGKPLASPCWMVRASQLSDPELFLNLLRRT